ncbi:hypothetical protein DFH09DRAFT_1309708 [Mycena vulgaris]|nr:hypothetical protein DFH09DRAFT_1309708 [Mycena vulgaris]
MMWIEVSAYLTYTVVSNATFNVAACQDWCRNNVAGCVFVNLYYEFNNELLDFIFSEKPNLKCAAYSDIHNAAEKSNFGEQSSYPQPVPPTYITQSSGWALNSYYDPDAPDGGMSWSLGPLVVRIMRPGCVSSPLLPPFHLLSPSL